MELAPKKSILAICKAIFPSLVSVEFLPRPRPIAQPRPRPEKWPRPGPRLVVSVDPCIIQENSEKRHLFWALFLRFYDLPKNKPDGTPQGTTDTDISVSADTDNIGGFANIGIQRSDGLDKPKPKPK